MVSLFFSKFKLKLKYQKHTFCHVPRVQGRNYAHIQGIQTTC